MGAATALLLARRSANVTLIGRREQPLREVEHEISAAGGIALVVPADVSDLAAMQSAVDRTVDRFGALHHAVNNAGIGSESHDIPELPTQIWDSTIAINLSSLFYGMRAQLPAIAVAGSGAVVNVSSVYADRSLPTRAASAAAKHGIRGLTRSAARDRAERGIRINELQPGRDRHPDTWQRAGRGRCHQGAHPPQTPRPARRDRRDGRLCTFREGLVHHRRRSRRRRWMAHVRNARHQRREQADKSTIRFGGSEGGLRALRSVDPMPTFPALSASTCVLGDELVHTRLLTTAPGRLAARSELTTRDTPGWMTHGVPHPRNRV
jgi:NAD(P)-dependent dehydrogenase (short-subunit alcohol dehydrogenase family)